jgi:hypothetical protein
MASTPTAACQVALSAALLTVLATPLSLAQPRGGSIPTTLAERQALMRQINVQQQSVLETRSRCINQAKTLQELERCERGYPIGMPGWHRYGGGGMGGWSCPMW